MRRSIIAHITNSNEAGSTVTFSSLLLPSLPACLLLFLYLRAIPAVDYRSGNIPYVPLDRVKGCAKFSAIGGKTQASDGIFAATQWEGYGFEARTYIPYAHPAICIAG